MSRYTHKDDKKLENWMFHEDYFTDESRFLPKSIQNELAKRLTDCARNPLTREQLKDINPIIEVKLKSICDAYRNKQARSRRASAAKRAPKAADTSGGESDSESESESEEEDEHVEFHKFMSDFRTRLQARK